MNDENRNKAITNFMLTQTKLPGRLPNMTNDEKQMFGHDLNNTLLSCFYDHEPCSSLDFQWELELWQLF